MTGEESNVCNKNSASWWVRTNLRDDGIQEFLRGDA